MWTAVCGAARSVGCVGACSTTQRDPHSTCGNTLAPWCAAHAATWLLLGAGGGSTARSVPRCLLVHCVCAWSSINATAGVTSVRVCDAPQPQCTEQYSGVGSHHSTSPRRMHASRAHSPYQYRYRYLATVAGYRVGYHDHGVGWAYCSAGAGAGCHRRRRIVGHRSHGRVSTQHQCM